MQEAQKMWDQSVGREDPLEGEMATRSSVLGWKNSMDRGAWRGTVHGVAKTEPARAQSQDLRLHPLPHLQQPLVGSGSVSGS